MQNREGDTQGKDRKKIKNRGAKVSFYQTVSRIVTHMWLSGPVRLQLKSVLLFCSFKHKIIKHSVTLKDDFKKDIL